MKNSFISFDCRYFLTISNETNILIYQISTSELVLAIDFVEHSILKITTVSWSRSTNEQHEQDIFGILAIGTEHGSIFLFDLDKKKIIKELGKPQRTKKKSSKTSSIQLYYQKNLLFSCYGNGEIVVWDIQKSKQTKKFNNSQKRSPFQTGKICVDLKKKTLLSTEPKCKLWDFNKGKLKKAFSTNKNEFVTNQLNQVEKNYNIDLHHLGGNYITNTNTDSNIIEFWKMSDDSPHKVLKSNHKMYDIQFNPSNYLNDNEFIIKGFNDNTISIFRIRLQQRKRKLNEEESSENSIIIPSIQMSLDKKIEGRILATTFFSSTEIIVAYGTKHKPSFKQIKYLNKKKFVENVIISDSKTKNESNNENNEEEFTNEEQISLEDKIKTLGLVKEEQIESNNEDKQNEIKNRQRGGSGLKTMIAVLEQALKTEDSSLLEKVILVDDPEIINNTTKELQLKYIFVFINKLVRLMKTKNDNLMPIIRWMRAILNNHLSYLISLPNLVERLSKLYQMIDYRLSNFQELSELSGKLDLLLDKVNVMKTREKVETFSKPLAVFYVSDESDSDDQSDAELSDSISDIEEEELLEEMKLSIFGLDGNDDMFDDEELDF
ncbi:wd repeat-containing protein [Anaeramoeba flamelloides]|uniref:Wd repeat-containing protein n=1 Tax=Anaeramoeba flamelloides TaxID=1746091 RepID=A0ABQ8Y3P8_9EUKA|nr:wd repeat-containing protein [Anaeramoeba flamelloides]